MRSGPLAAWGLVALAAAPRCCSAAPAAEAKASAEDCAEEWYCGGDKRGGLSWEECRRHLPSERDAMAAFLKALATAAVPPPGEFEGRGIVMSGGPMHVMQAVANLRVVRAMHGSSLRAEFWHAFELSPVHCRVLLEAGAECRAIRLPGVYVAFQTFVPTIMLSSFRHVIWLDTDATLLHPPERLLESQAYGDTGALFWPDHWGAGCHLWGQSARPDNVIWHLLDIDYDPQDPACSHEAELSLMVIDKERHWRALCLANYLSTRHFMTDRLMHGTKEAFRFAWKKLNASSWLSPVRPGVVGVATSLLGTEEDEAFMPLMVQMWPAGGEFGSAGHGRREVPLYVHQKKKPGRGLTQSIITFPAPLGECAPMRITRNLFAVGAAGDMVVWDLARDFPDIAPRLDEADSWWELGWREARDRLLDDARVSLEDLAALLSPEKGPKVSRRGFQSVLARELSLRRTGNSSAAAVSTFEGVWDVRYARGLEVAYVVDATGGVVVQGHTDGVGVGRIYRYRRAVLGGGEGFTHALFGIQSAGKWERLRLAGPSLLELEHWAGETLADTATGKLRSP